LNRRKPAKNAQNNAEKRAQSAPQAAPTPIFESTTGWPQHLKAQIIINQWFMSLLKRCLPPYLDEKDYPLMRMAAGPASNPAPRNSTDRTVCATLEHLTIETP
jgi:hypothetical protein